MLEILTRKRWSAWFCGAITGVTAALATVLAGKIMGTSGTFETLASMLVSFFHLHFFGSYFTMVRLPMVSYQVIQAVGILAGAFIAALLSDSFRLRTLPDREWTDHFGSSRVKRWGSLFIGCALLEIGADIAGGCTSGLGISGTMLLSPAGVIFIIGVFSAGILTTKLLFGGRY
jgi:uncharacterized membrane protein YedE/YeeE